MGLVRGCERYALPLVTRFYYSLQRLKDSLSEARSFLDIGSPGMWYSVQPPCESAALNTSLASVQFYVGAVSSFQRTGDGERADPLSVVASVRYACLCENLAVSGATRFAGGNAAAEDCRRLHKRSV